MTGKMTPQGFMPAEPSIEALLDKMGLGKGGWDQMNGSAAGKPVEEARISATEDLKRNYVQFFNSPAGRKVLEDIVEQTLRRAPGISLTSGQAATLEMQTAFMLERMGQNGIVTYILKMIHDGAKLPAPGSRKRKS